MGTAFTDGAKHEDVSKVSEIFVAKCQLTESPQQVVFIAQNIIPRDDQEGWQLLRCIRSFSILDLLISFEAHTERTISAGRAELERFGRLMMVFILFYFS